MSAENRKPDISSQEGAMLWEILNESHVAISVEQTTFDDSPAIALPNIPTDAMFALVVLEKAATSSEENLIARYKEVGTPTTTAGMPLGHLDAYLVDGSDNINNFKIIGVEAGITLTLNVTYYKSNNGICQKIQ